MDATEINDLPNELLFSILKHLKVKEQPPCRLVCRRFLSICDVIKVTELVISNTIENINDLWFPTNESFNHKDAIDVATFLARRSKLQPESFLKRLYFKGTFADYRKLNVNGLTNIEQLTVNITYRNHADPAIHIDLPNLKILHDRSGESGAWHLNTPKLQTLKCDAFYFTPAQFYHPDTIKHIELSHYFEAAASLKNIEYLKVEKRFENIRLENHPQLKHLVFNHRYFDEDSDEYVVSMEALRKLVKEKGRQLQIYYQSVKLENVEKVEEYNRPNRLAFQISNYDSLADHIDCYHIEYSKLMEMFNHTLPNDFFAKYFDVRSISAKGNVKNESHFVGFLKSFRYLNILRLDGAHFDQSFYNFLPEMDQLTELHFKKLPKPITRFDFLFKMSRLENFSTEQDSKCFFDLAEPMFQQLKYLKYLRFCYEKNVLWTLKSHNSYIFLQEKVNEDGSGGGIIFRKDDVDDLSKFFDEFLNSNLSV